MCQVKSKLPVILGIAPSGQIIYTRTSDAPPNRQELYSVNADGTGTIVLTNAPDHRKYFMGVTSGGQVIYERQLITGGDIDLYSVNVDGTGAAVLANSTDNDYFSSITPSGRVIYERYVSASGQMDIYSVNADGTGTVPLANSIDNEYIYPRF